MRARDLGFRLAVFTLGALSIASLLLYFFGVARFGTLAATLLPIEVVGLAALGIHAAITRNQSHVRLLVTGLWAGCLATVVYDLVRVPIVHAGLPVFKAISYLGTVLLGVERPTVLSEILGWTYHLSNGVSFGLMYAAIATRPGLVSAVLWGLSLEGAMLLTPYAEVFGYQRDLRFLAITIGSHAAFGATLWLALRGARPDGAGQPPLRPLHYGAGITGVLLVLLLVAADSHRLHAARAAQSPPPYIGPKLYTTWNVPEPDRVSAIWIVTRFVDRDVKFHFVQPFDKIRFGTPFDVPEAGIRRHGMQSATEFLIAREKLALTPKLAALARMTNLTEVSPWMLAASSEAGRLAERFRGSAAAACGHALSAACVDDLLRSLDRWYEDASQ